MMKKRMNEKKSYKELLKDPRWQKRRLEILQRDRFTCQHCGRNDRTLHVHHKRYVEGKNPWEYSDEDLITLCEECHNNETEYASDLYRVYSELQESFMVNGFSMQLFSTVLELISEALELHHWDKAYYTPAVDLIKNAFFRTKIQSDMITLSKYVFNAPTDNEKDFVESVFDVQPYEFTLSKEDIES